MHFHAECVDRFELRVHVETLEYEVRWRDGRMSERKVKQLLKLAEEHMDELLLEAATVVQWE